MRVVVDTNVFVSAALKEKSQPGMAVHLVAESGVFLKSTVTERELFVTLARPRLAPLIPRRFRFRAGFLWPRGVPDGLGAAQCRDVLPGADQGLYVRPDLPRRELEHQPPPRRVLDDRAGDRLRRPLGQCGARGSAAEIHLQGVAERKTGRSRLL